MKRNLILFILFLLSFLGFSQNSNDKTIYLDSLDKETTKENHTYYKIVKDYYLDKSEYKTLIYFKNGKIKRDCILSGKEGGSLIGQSVSYYENGNKQSIINYVSGRPSGKSIVWYENGNKKEEVEYLDVANKINGKQAKLTTFWDSNNKQAVIDGNGDYFSEDEDCVETGKYKNGFKDGVWKIKNLKDKYSFSETYKNGEFISGESTDSFGIKDAYFAVETPPKPKKDMKDFYEFIANNFRITSSSIRYGIKGKIILTFVIEKDGKITEAKIVKGLGYGLDEEAIRVVSSYENWIPGKQKGRAVRVLYTLPISI